MLFIILAMIMTFFATVNAHAVELDPDSLISFPMIITNGQGILAMIVVSIISYKIYARYKDVK